MGIPDGRLADLFEIQIWDATFDTATSLDVRFIVRHDDCGAARIKIGPVAFLDPSPYIDL